MSNTDTQRFEVFFDGDCPLCRREIELVRKLDRRGAVGLTDIASPSFDPRSVGRSHGELMAEIHGRTPDGQWVTGVEVFRRIYEAVGMPFISLTRLPGVRHALDAGYRLFAANRLRITGRCTDELCAPRAQPS